MTTSQTSSKTVSTSELQTLVAGKTAFLLLDVRPKAQFDEDHIGGAKNVPFDSADFLAAVDRAAGAESNPIVVYSSDTSCTTPTRQERKAGGK